MSQPNSIYKIQYEAQNFRSGLTDIICVIKKPNDTETSPISLTEQTGYFSGTYRGEYSVAVNDPLGEYIGIVFSPTEGHKSSFRFDVFEGGVIAGQQADDNVEISVQSINQEIVVHNPEEINFNSKSSRINLDSLSKSFQKLSASSKKAMLAFSGSNAVILEIDCDI